MRYLDSARNVHQGHTAAVIDVDYAPSGQEFVSGSYDCSLRIFNVEEWRSRYDFLSYRFIVVIGRLLGRYIMRLECSMCSRYCGRLITSMCSREVTK